MPTTSNWQAAKNGFPGDFDATNHAAQVSQELGTHAINIIHNGTRTLMPDGGTQFTKFTAGNSLDYDQPFTLSGTSIGRVVIPIGSNGNAADLHVNLYPDNGSGSPDITNLLASATVPALQIRNMVANEGLENSSTAAQTAFTNTQYFSGSITQINWAGPPSGSAGVAGNAGFVTSGNYMIFVSGGPSSSPINTVATVEYQGGDVLALPMLQPPLPTAVFGVGATTTSTSVIAVGGYDGTNPSSKVWTASWDVNTGTIGAWSSQTSLPFTLFDAGVTSYNDFVYVVGGTNTGASVTDTVVYANVSNGQISSWLTGPPVPKAVAFPMLTVCSGWLVCAGGTDATTTPYNDVWMARILSDGSINGWVRGPSLPTAVYAYAPGWDVATTDNSIVLVGGFIGSGSTTDAVQIMSLTENDFSGWRRTRWNPSNVEAVGAFDNGVGEWQLMNPVIDNSIYRTSVLTPTGTLSVPLHAAGLTNGNVYHIVLQQNQTQSANDYLSINLLDDTPLPLPALKSNRNANTWSDAVGTGWSIPIEVYNNDANSGDDIIHTWEDAIDTGSPSTSNVASATSTRTYDYLHQLRCYTDVVTLPNDALNANPTFTNGVGSWTVTNCTLTQSNAQTHGGYSFSGLLTPTGGFSQAFVESDRVPIGTSNAVLGTERWFAANGWFYSPGGYLNFSLSINWYDSSGALISTSANVISLAAATWTNVVNTFLAPSTAHTATLVPTESGTPLVTDTVYMSNVTLTSSLETSTSFSSMIVMDYDLSHLAVVSTTQLT